MNWLIARARAEEIRFGPADPHQTGVERLGAGRQWLEEAELIAETESVRLRVLREMVARLIALGDIQHAAAMIERAQAKLPSATSRAAITQWRARLADASNAIQQKNAQRHQLANQAYQNVLQKRLQRAAARSDPRAEARYRQLLHQAAPHSATQQEKP